MGRQIRVEIIGDARKLRSAFREAERSTSGFARGIAKAGVFAASGLAGVAVGAGVAITSAVKSAATFDKTLRQMAAVSDIPAAGLENLRKLALKMGADTQFSAQQAADAMLELAKGGLTAAQIKAGGLKATLTLAAAGSLDLADAATFMANALNGFALQAKDANKVAAALAGGANASTASVESLGEALSQVGPGARNAGLSLQQTVGVLAAFDQAGIKGSDAGTSLKTMLAALVPQTSKASTAMHKLGLDFVDAHGAIVPITEVAQQLHDRLGRLTQAQRIQALQTIFGSDATRAATVLMNQGAKGIQQYIRATLDQDAAQKLAKASMDGTAGALEQMQGSIETAKIALGTAFAPAAVAAARGVTKIANAAGELIQKHGPQLKKLFDDLGGSVSDFAVKHGPDLKNAFQQAKDGLGSLNEGLTDPNNGAVSGLDKLKHGWEENKVAIRDLKKEFPSFQTIMRAIGFLTGRAGEELTGAGRAVISFAGMVSRGMAAARVALDVLGIAALELLDALQTMAANGLESLAELASHIPGLSGSVAKGLRDGVERIRNARADTKVQIDKLKADVDQRMQALRAGMRTTMGQAGREGPAAMAGGISSKREQVAKASRAIAAAATNPLRLQNVARTLGQEAGLGLAQGFGSKRVHQAVYNAVHGTVQIIEGQSRRILRIESPSKVMFRVGELAGLGLAKGLASQVQTISAAGTAAGSAGAVSLGRAMAAARGWTGGQWNALFKLWSHESGWNPNAQNPTSTAYGIAQFLDSTWAGTGYRKTSNPGIQIAAGLKYIAQRYGNPANAWAAWLSRSPHWYGSGMPPTVFSQPTLIGVGERGPETVSVTPRGHGGGIDYQRLAAAIVAALQASPPIVRVDDLLAGQARHDRRLGGVVR